MPFITKLSNLMKSRTLNDAIVYSGINSGTDAVAWKVSKLDPACTADFTVTDATGVTASTGAIPYNTDNETTIDDFVAGINGALGALIDTTRTTVLGVKSTGEVIIVAYALVPKVRILASVAATDCIIEILENADGRSLYSQFREQSAVLVVDATNLVYDPGTGEYIISNAGKTGKAVWLAYDQTSGRYCFGVNTTDETGAIIDTTYYSTADGSVYVPGGSLIPIENVGKTIIPKGAGTAKGSFSDAAALTLAGIGITIPVSVIATRARVYVYMDPTSAVGYAGNCATWTTNGQTPAYAAGAPTGFPVANNGYIDLDYSEYNTFKIIGNEAGKTHGVYVQFYS